MVFRMNKAINDNAQQGITFEVVNDFDYLGHVITNTLWDTKVFCPR